MSDRGIITAAAEWFARLQEDDVSEDDFQQWQNWLKAAPEHEHAYQEIERGWQLIAKVDPPPWVSAQELRQDGRQLKSHPLRWALAATVILSIAFSVAPKLAELWSTPDYSTVTAEQRSIRLPDGSRVTIGAESRITPMFESSARRIALDYGEAFFEVAHDPAHPFIVVANGTEIRAVGTAFNVRTSDGQVLVSVTEGRVAVTPPASPSSLVSAGHQAVLTAAGKIEQQARPTSEIATWREGRFEYRGEALRHVIEDLNRYADPPIVLSDETAATLRYSGTVFPDHIDEWLKGISGALPVVVQESGGKRLIAHAP